MAITTLVAGGVALGTYFLVKAEGEDLLIPVLSGVLIGGLTFGLGTVVSAVHRSEAWEEVNRPSVQPSLQLSPDGRFGLRFSVPLRR